MSTVVSTIVASNFVRIVVGIGVSIAVSTTVRVVVSTVVSTIVSIVASNFVRIIVGIDISIAVNITVRVVVSTFVSTLICIISTVDKIAVSNMKYYIYVRAYLGCSFQILCLFTQITEIKFSTLKKPRVPTTTASLSVFTKPLVCREAILPPLNSSIIFSNTSISMDKGRYKLAHIKNS